jgi:hypothetical protein
MLATLIGGLFATRIGYLPNRNRRQKIAGMFLCAFGTVLAFSGYVGPLFFVG